MIEALARKEINFFDVQLKEIETYAVKQLRLDAWNEKIGEIEGKAQKIGAYVLGFFKELLRFISFGAYPGRVEEPSHDKIQQRVDILRGQLADKVRDINDEEEEDEEEAGQVGGGPAAAAAGQLGGDGDEVEVEEKKTIVADPAEAPRVAAADGAGGEEGDDQAEVVGD